MSEVLGLERIVRTFVQAGNRLEVLKGVSLAVRAGEAVALLGPSGAGKSTLLHIAGLLERADGGAVLIDGRDCAALSDNERTAARREKLGFVYQFHRLLPEFSALENVVLPQMILGRSKAEAAVRATDLLRRLGLGERLGHRPARLSGGEQQRVAIARALANGPRLLLADEPTGNLDSRTAELVFGELVGLIREHRVGALIATHNLELARRMDRIVTLQDGRLIEA